MTGIFGVYRYGAANSAGGILWKNLWGKKFVLDVGAVVAVGICGSFSTLLAERGIEVDEPGQH